MAEARTARTAAALAPIAATIPGRSNGNFACGSFRFTSGRTANASSSRSGPQPVRVGEARDADRDDDGATLVLRHERLDRVPQAPARLGARPSLSFARHQLVVARPEHLADERELLVDRLPR